MNEKWWMSLNHHNKVMDYSSGIQLRTIGLLVLAQFIVRTTFVQELLVISNPLKSFIIRKFIKKDEQI